MNTPPNQPPEWAIQAAREIIGQDSAMSQEAAEAFVSAIDAARTQEGST